MSRNSNLDVRMSLTDIKNDLLISLKRGSEVTENIWKASANNDLETVKQYIEQGGLSIDILDNHMKTPLHYAAENNSRDVISYLLEKHASVSKLDCHQKVAHRQDECAEGTKQFILSRIKKEPEWVSDMMSTDCLICKSKFNLFRRRHHCRNCGILACSKCTSFRANLPKYHLYTPQRICIDCITVL